MKRQHFLAMNLAAASLLSLLFIPVNAVQTEEQPHVHDHLETSYESPHSQFAGKVNLAAIKCTEGL